MNFQKHYCPKKQLVLNVFLLFLFSIQFSLPAFAQKDITKKKKEQRAYNHFGLGLQAGTHALFGVDLSVGLSDFMAIRAGYNHMQLSISNLELDASSLGFSNQTLLIGADLKLSTLSLILDVYPFENKRIRFMGGAMYGLDNSISMLFSFKENLVLNDFELTPDRIGYFSGLYNTPSSIYPYIGVGYGKTMPENRFSVNVELGGFLRGKPNVELESTGLLRDNQHNEPIIENRFRSYQWHPTLSVRLAYKISIPKDLFKKKQLSPEEIEQKENEKIARKASKKKSQNNTTEIEEPSLQDTANSISEEEVSEEETPEAEASDNYGDTYPYVVFKGDVYDQETNQVLDYFYLTVYWLKLNGQKELVRTGRFNDGSFTVGLERVRRYEIIIQHNDYETKVVEKQINESYQQLNMNQSFYLQKK